MLSGTRPESLAPQLPLPSSVPAHIERAIKRCLENDPARRFASVSEVRDAIAGRPAVQAVRKLTIPLLVSLAVAVSVSIPLWNYSWVTKSPAVREERRDSYSVTPPVERE